MENEKHRGDADEIAIKSILKSLSDDQKDAMLANDAIKAFWGENDIDEPEDCGDIIGDLNSWEPEQRNKFVKLLTEM